MRSALLLLPQQTKRQSLTTGWWRSAVVRIPTFRSKAFSYIPCVYPTQRKCSAGGVSDRGCSVYHESFGISNPGGPRSLLLCSDDLSGGQQAFLEVLRKKLETTGGMRCRFGLARGGRSTNMRAEVNSNSENSATSDTKTCSRSRHMPSAYEGRLQADSPE